MEKVMRVLITDSDRPFLEIELAYLRKCGYEVITAADGLQCNELLREFTPDVMVIDCEVAWAMIAAAEMQKNRTQRPIPAILISDTNPSESSHIQFPLAGWFRKPFSMFDLQQKIASLCPKPELSQLLS
jgi:DNA-binding response OmpR family regulator